VILNSAELPISESFTKPTWDEVRRIYRRIGVLRATGRNEEAADLEHGELPRVLTAARIQSSAPDQEEAAVFAEEAERLANATVTAEILASLLAERLRLPAVEPRAENPRPAATAATPRANEFPPAPPRPVPATSPTITDLLDGMLSQETAAARTKPRP